MNLRQPRSIIVPESLAPDEDADMLEARVLRVFDGDGFLASAWQGSEERCVRAVPFRFAFIDAPEMGQPFAAEAKAFLHAAIAGKVLKLAPISKESTGSTFDAYRRLLCMAFLTEEMRAGPIAYYHNGACGSGVVKLSRPVTRNIELEMLINGWAWVLKQYAFDRDAEYVAAQEDARLNRRGLWAAERPVPPWIYKQRKKRQSAAVNQQANFTY